VPCFASEIARIVWPVLINFELHEVVEVMRELQACAEVESIRTTASMQIRGAPRLENRGERKPRLTRRKKLLSPNNRQAEQKS